MPKPISRESESFLRPWHVLLLFLGVIALLGYSFQVLVKSYTVDPEKICAQYFANTRDRIKNLQGGGDISSVYDTWLTFDCPDVVRFKAPYKFIADAEPDRQWHYFLDKFPDEKDLRMHGDLEGWTLNDHPDPVTITNAWLVGNRKTNRYWFRVWGRK